MDLYRWIPSSYLWWFLLPCLNEFYFDKQSNYHWFEKAKSLSDVTVACRLSTGDSWNWIILSHYNYFVVLNWSYYCIAFKMGVVILVRPYCLCILVGPYFMLNQQPDFFQHTKRKKRIMLNYNTGRFVSNIDGQVFSNAHLDDSCVGPFSAPGCCFVIVMTQELYMRFAFLLCSLG